MGMNWAGMAAGYQGFQEDQQKQADEARRVKQDARADQDQAFQEEHRGRARKDWAKTDGIEARRLADLAELDGDERFNGKGADASVLNAPGKSLAADENQSAAESNRLLGSASAHSTLAAPGIGRVGGVPKPRNFNDVLARNAEILNRQFARGDVNSDIYTQTIQNMEKFKKEGANDALEHFARGDYQGGIDKFNSIGQLNNTKFIGGREGVTKINGVDMPTHFVDLIGSDGQRVTMDVTKARAQLMSMNEQMAHADKGASRQITAKHYAAAEKNQEGMLAIHQQNADTQEQYRKDQGARLSEQSRLQGAGQAPTWSAEDNKSIQKLYTSQNQEGNDVVDHEGAIFAQQVGMMLSASSKYKGNSFAAIYQAKIADNKFKEQAKNNPAELARLRNEALQSLVSAKNPENKDEAVAKPDPNTAAVPKSLIEVGGFKKKTPEDSTEKPRFLTNDEINAKLLAESKNKQTRPSIVSDFIDWRTNSIKAIEMRSSVMHKLKSGIQLTAEEDAFAKSQKIK